MKLLFVTAIILILGVACADDHQDLKASCQRNGGPEAYGELSTSKDAMKAYAEENLEPNKLKEEFEKKKEEKKFVEIVGDFCDKMTEFKKIMDTAHAAAEHCMTDEDKKKLKLAVYFVDYYEGASCVLAKNGVDLAEFVENGGLECYKSIKDAVEKCQSASSTYATVTNFSWDKLPLIDLNRETCDDIRNYQNCAMEAFSSCESTVPKDKVQIYQDWFNQFSPCKKIK